MKEPQYFENLNFDEFNKKVLLIDIDGTLTSDSDYKLSDKTINTINRIKRHNYIYLCTNSRNKKRNAFIEKQLKLRIVNQRYRKPSRKILREIKHHKDRDTIVIGDKFLTDGIFSKKIKAGFIKVKRKKSTNERYFIKVLYWLDDIAYSLLCRTERKKF